MNFMSATYWRTSVDIQSHLIITAPAASTHLAVNMAITAHSMIDTTPVVTRNMNRKNNIRSIQLSVYTRGGQDTQGLFVRPTDVLTRLVSIYVVPSMLE